MATREQKRRATAPRTRKGAGPAAAAGITPAPGADDAAARGDEHGELSAAEAAAPAASAATEAGPGPHRPAEPEPVAIADVPGLALRLADEADEPPVSGELKAVVESLIFASPEPLTLKAICKVLDSEPREDVERALEALKRDYAQPRGLQLVEIAGGYQIVTRTDLHEWVRRLFHERKSTKLSVQALESLAVIAYRQPVTAAEITEIRGVNASGVLSTLIERKLVKIAGRKAVVGRPFLYATTREFLMRFGLNDLRDLPRVEDMADLLGFDLPGMLGEPVPSDQMLPLDLPGETAAPPDGPAAAEATMPEAGAAGDAAADGPVPGTGPDPETIALWVDERPDAPDDDPPGGETVN